jgi:diaminohydroxyphosphoribosylaminopyrimidine deaminase/5-amino-6-(5-phosphoribosylamino)uracil reductase
MAPHVMGANARGLFNLPAIDKMSDRIKLKYQDVRQVGDDLKITLQAG